MGSGPKKLQALQRGGDRSRPRLGGEPGSREAGGTLPEVQGDWQPRMRGGAALGEELTGQNRQRADWTARKELARSGRSLVSAGGGGVAGARGREGEEAGPACRRAGRAASAAGAHSSSAPVLSSGPPCSGLGSRGGKRGEGKRARGAGRRGRGALRCRPVLAGRCGPGARGAPRRAHYAGGLPAAAMASRAPLRAARSPQGLRGRAAPAATGRAALPSAGCCPLPPGRNSSSRPRLILLLLLLFQDAGAQQGE